MLACYDFVETTIDAPFTVGTGVFVVTNERSAKSILSEVLDGKVNNNLKDDLVNSVKDIYYRKSRYTTIYIFTDCTFEDFEVIGCSEESETSKWIMTNLLYTNDIGFKESSIPKITTESSIIIETFDFRKVYCIRHVHKEKNCERGLTEDIVLYLPLSEILV